jgi:hypothetical protein
MIGLVIALGIVSLLWGVMDSFWAIGNMMHHEALNLAEFAWSIFFNLCVVAMAIWIAGSAAGKGSSGYEFLQASWWWIALITLGAHTTGLIFARACKKK